MIEQIKHRLGMMNVEVRAFDDTGYIDADIGGRRAVAYPDLRTFDYLPIWADTGETVTHYVWELMRAEVRLKQIATEDAARANEAKRPSD